MANKKVVLQTKDSNLGTFKVNESSRGFDVYHVTGSRRSDFHLLGTSSSLRDALDLIRSNWKKWQESEIRALEHMQCSNDDATDLCNWVAMSVLRAPPEMKVSDW